MPLDSRDITEIFQCTRTPALAFMKKLQDESAALGEKVYPNYLTREQFIRYLGMTYEQLRDESLALIAAQAKTQKG